MSRTAPSRSRARLTAAVLATALGAVLSSGVPAAAVTGDGFLRYAGASALRATLPAAVVQLDAVSSSSFTSVELLVSGRSAGRDTTVSREGTMFVGSLPVDLSARRGHTGVTMRFTSSSGTWNVDKWFTVSASGVIPAPTPTPTLAPAPAPAPVPAAYPRDTSKVGLPDGIALRPSGSLTITTPGTVIDGLDIAGCVVVAASDVVIRNTRIRCARPGTVMAVEVRGARLLVEHSEIDGAGVAEIGIGWSDYTLRDVEIHHVVDGARFGHRVLIEDSWIHDMVRIGTLHPDAVQTTSASTTTIRRNVLDPMNTASGAHNNAAVQLGSETGTRAVRDVVIEDNLLGGGQVALNVRGDITASGVVVRRNAFAPTSRSGHVLAPASFPLGEANVLLSTGTAVPVILAR